MLLKNTIYNGGFCSDFEQRSKRGRLDGLTAVRWYFIHFISIFLLFLKLSLLDEETKIGLICFNKLISISQLAYEQ